MTDQSQCYPSFLSIQLSTDPNYYMVQVILFQLFTHASRIDSTAFKLK